METFVVDLDDCGKSCALVADVCDHGKLSSLRVGAGYGVQCLVVAIDQGAPCLLVVDQRSLRALVDEADKYARCLLVGAHQPETADEGQDNLQGMFVGHNVRVRHV